MSAMRSLLAGVVALGLTRATLAQDAELPAVDLTAPAAARLSDGVRVFVREFRVVGGEVLDPDDLAAALGPFTGRELDSAELIGARDALTQLYHARGFITSGAVVPDQPVGEGVIELRLVEGRLGEIEIEGLEGFDVQHVRARIATDGPLNVRELERRLQRLQQDPRIRRVDARLEPGADPELSRLRVTVEEAPAWHISLTAANDASPSLGGLRTGIAIGHANLTGRGDTLIAGATSAQGLIDVDVSYTIPLTAADTRLELGHRQIRSRVVDGPLAPLDVEAERTSWRIGLAHPFWRDRDGEWVGGLMGELRRSRLRVLGERFSFLPSPSRGETRVSVLRAQQELRLRSETQAFALRFQASVGVDVFDASIYPSSQPGTHVPDGRFLAGLVQAQWVGRLDDWIDGAQLVVGADLQLSRDPLLPMERISIGGSHSVRGYHENELVRDNGLIASVELRVPVLRDALGRDRLQLAPFADFGRGWNREGPEPLRSIASVGLGLRWRVSERAELEAYWGSRLRSVDDRDGEGLQDAGIHVRLRVSRF